VDGFEVQVSQLLDAAKAAASAAGQARAVDLGAALEAVASALPGGAAAASAPVLASMFNERAKVWADEIDHWSEAVTSAAKVYAESEEAARIAFG
jgi:hypothetical protein